MQIDLQHLELLYGWSAKPLVPPIVKYVSCILIVFIYLISVVDGVYAAPFARLLYTIGMLQGLYRR